MRSQGVSQRVPSARQFAGASQAAAPSLGEEDRALLVGEAIRAGHDLEALGVALAGNQALIVPS